MISRIASRTMLENQISMPKSSRLACVGSGEKREVTKVTWNPLICLMFWLRLSVSLTDQSFIPDRLYIQPSGRDAMTRFSMAALWFDFNCPFKPTSSLSFFGQTLKPFSQFVVFPLFFVPSSQLLNEAVFPHLLAAVL